MKICLINNLYPPHARGGAEQVVYKTVQGLLQDGHEVVVITTAPGGAHVWREGKLSIYRFQPRNLFFYTNAHKHYFLIRLIWHLIDMFHYSAANHVKSILEEEKPDVVHTHNLMGMSFLIPQKIRELKIRHLHTVHDVQLVEPSGIILKQHESDWRYTGFFTRLYTSIMKKLMGSPDVVISPSQFLLNFYEKRGFFTDSKRVMLRNPVTVITDNRIEITDQRSKINFLYLGQIEEHKGALFLVKTFLELTKTVKDKAILHVAGSGSQLEYLKELTKDRPEVVIHSKVERKALPDLFSKTDVLIAPSLCYENSPTVIFESFSFAVPVLASRVEGIAELIREGENGITFETGDKRSLLVKLQWCLDNKEKIEEMSKKTTQYLDGLSEMDYIKKLSQLYDHR